ncbi:MAG: hypothetical protein HUU17_05185 [Chthonomonadales bacterium]|nr:hypothetical protein [Chthonomonadales bacterium]
MSYEIGMAAMRLEMAERIGHTEYHSNYALIRAVTGKEPTTDPDAWRAFNDAWEIDLIWSTNDGPTDWALRGRVTDMGHAEFLEHGADWRDTVTCPFATVDEVLAFDAVSEYGLPDFEELVRFYEQAHRSAQTANPNQIHTAGYYKTIISGAIQAFGWDMLLAAAADRAGFARVLDSFFELAAHHFRAWARTSAPVFIDHDDFVWSAGAFMSPAFYRAEIIPRYRRLWQILHEAGKTVLFCSDGDWSIFIDDIAEAGADGFIFEPTTDLEHIVRRYGQTHVIVGSKVDCRTLTFGDKEEIAAEVRATLGLAQACPGFMVAVGNHIPSNVPVDNALWYFDCLRSGWRR